MKTGALGFYIQLLKNKVTAMEMGILGFLKMISYISCANKRRKEKKDFNDPRNLRIQEDQK